MYETFSVISSTGVAKGEAPDASAAQLESSGVAVGSTLQWCVVCAATSWPSAAALRQTAS